MAFNIVDLVKSDISDHTLGRIGSAVGMDGSQTSIAMSGAVPGLLSGLATKARQPGGASSLLDSLRGADDGLLGNASSMLNDGQSAQLADRGGSLLASVLGGNATGKLAGALGSFTGLGHDRGGSLLGVLAPIVLGALKRKFAGDDLDANGVQELMSAQQSNIDAAMPEGFADSLRSEGFFDSIGASEPSTASASTASGSAPEPAQAPASAQARAPSQPSEPAPVAAAPAASPGPTPGAADARPAPGSSGGGLPGWLLPVAAVVVVALLALLFLGGDDEADVPVAATGAAGDAPAVTVAAAAGVSEETLAAADAALPEGVTMAGLTGQLDEVFTTSRNALSGVTDAASAEAALPQLQEADGQLDDFLGLYRRLPAVAQGPLAQIVTTATTSLAPIADTALEIPGVGPILDPVVRPMLDKLAGVEG